MSEPITCIIGLGNIGANYQATRHNVGFWLLDSLAVQQRLNFHLEKKFFGFYAQTSGVHLLKPETFMNRSGQAVQALLAFYRIPIEHMLVVHDDIDLPAGTAKLKRSGGHGGHNGLRDIINRTARNEFLRLRLGVGRPSDSKQMVNYVLNPPSLDEKNQIETAINHSLAVLPQVLTGQLAQAMNFLHRG